jgi:hypothetical protein
MLILKIYPGLFLFAAVSNQSSTQIILPISSACRAMYVWSCDPTLLIQYCRALCDLMHVCITTPGCHTIHRLSEIQRLTLVCSFHAGVVLYICSFTLSCIDLHWLALQRSVFPITGLSSKQLSAVPYNMGDITYCDCALQYLLYGQPRVRTGTRDQMRAVRSVASQLPYCSCYCIL